MTKQLASGSIRGCQDQILDSLGIALHSELLGPRINAQLDSRRDEPGHVMDRGHRDPDEPSAGAGRDNLCSCLMDVDEVVIGALYSAVGPDSVRQET